YQPEETAPQAEEEKDLLTQIQEAKTVTQDEKDGSVIILPLLMVKNLFSEIDLTAGLETVLRHGLPRQHMQAAYQIGKNNQQVDKLINQEIQTIDEKLQEYQRAFKESPELAKDKLNNALVNTFKQYRSSLKQILDNTEISWEERYNQVEQAAETFIKQYKQVSNALENRAKSNLYEQAILEREQYNDLYEQYLESYGQEALNEFLKYQAQADDNFEKIRNNAKLTMDQQRELYAEELDNLQASLQEIFDRYYEAAMQQYQRSSTPAFQKLEKQLSPMDEVLPDANSGDVHTGAW
ncbi:MAG: hypothetical protein IKO35_02245, partial [Elusimicrobiaceae bacterium]|nr:hypothetical protein [Elusimicrobiaceae bacterium]